jgi:DNA-binding winged helix-turn-helix (wHTH) protein/tetratricopeptide (TPR) repeat protein
MPGEPNIWTHKFESFCYDARTGELWKRGDRTRLSPHLGTLLEILIEHPGELVTREALRARVWPTDTFVDFEHGLTVAMNRLRQALGESSQQSALIETIPRRGYRWLAAVEKMPREDPAPRGYLEVGRRASRRRVGAVAHLLLVAAVVAVTVGLGWARWRNRPPMGDAGPAARSLQPSTSFASGGTDVPRAAYDAYVKGLLLPSAASSSHWRTKIQYLRLAILREPRDAAAHAELARVYTLGALFGFAPVREAIRDARSEALEALRIDERLADAHVAFGDVQLAGWDWAGASSEYERALSLEPGSERALESRARLLTYAGRFDRAVGIWKELRERDPVDPGKALNLATAYIHARRFDEAHAALERLGAHNPAAPRVLIARAIASAGKRICADALRDADRAMAGPQLDDDEVSYVAAGWVYATCGQRVNARRLLQRCESLTRSVIADPISLAVLYGALGDRERGLQLIERGVAERSPVAVVLDVDMMLDTLRPDPRFEPLASRVRRNRDAVAAALYR